MKKIFPILVLAGFFTFAYAQEEEVSDNAITDQNPARVNGFRISGGILDLGGIFKSELEPRLRQDAVFYSNQYNLNWHRYKNTYYLSPIGISYGQNIGIGTLFAFLESRGISGCENITGSHPRHRFLSFGIPGGTNTVNENTIQLSITDGGLGYQLSFDKFLITPKASGRYFQTNFAQNTLFFGNLTGLGTYDIRTNSSAIFLGTKLQYLFTESSSIFIDGSTNTFTPINGNETGSFHRIISPTPNTLYYASATLSQQIISSRLLTGYQHNFGQLGIVFGYQEETISTSYSKFTSLPVSIIGNNFNFDTKQFFLDRFLLSKNQMNTEIKSFYINLIYAY